VVVLAATGLEWRAVRRAVAGSGVPVVRCGVGLRRWDAPQTPGERGPALITCGLAGGLRADLPPGIVVIADSVAYEDGERLTCDPAWVTKLVAGARACGQEPVVGPMLTARRLVVGEARRAWAEKGFVAAEMETALLAAAGAPLGSLRVVLDAPSREVSAEWSRPAARVALDPRRWAETVWLATRAPRYARLAARCLAEALSAA
jgi:4-hydroxy-3-methylbut-2-enyl diphosphate reductase